MIVGGGAIWISPSRVPETGCGTALACGADTLVHDSTYSERHRNRAGGHAHSTAAEAGDVAARARVRRLILTHIGAEYHADVEALAAEARSRFGGEVEVARELVPYPL